VRRERLKRLSAEKTTRFPDTLEAMRDRKQNSIRDKKAADEEARCQIDREEAEHQRSFRIDVLDRAEKAFFNQSDRMKLLKSKQALAETVFHRQSQIAEKNARAQKLVEEEAEYHKYIMAKVKSGDEEEKRNKAKEEGKMEIIRTQREEQMESIRSQRKAEKDEFDAVGVAMRARVAEMAEEDSRKQLEKIALSEKTIADMMAGNEKILQVRAFEKKKRQEEEKLLSAEVAKIEDRKQARKDYTSKQLLEKQKQRDAIIDKAVILLHNASADKDAHLEKTVANHKAKEDAALELKQNKKEKLLADIKASRTEMVERKQVRFMQDWENDQALIAAAVEKKRLADEADDREKREKKAEVMRIKNAQKDEAENQARQKILNRIQQLERERFQISTSGNDDKRFKKAVVERMERNQREGITNIPLAPLLELSGVTLLPGKLDPSKRRQMGQARPV
jgi:hypothetical protein